MAGKWGASGERALKMHGGAALEAARDGGDDRTEN